MTDRVPVCRHGWPTELEPAVGYPEGWVQPAAEACPFCREHADERPLAYLPGVPAEVPRAPAA